MSMLYNIGRDQNRMQSQTVTFRDGETEWTTSMSSREDSTRHQTVHEDVTLSDFFKRPIVIYKSTWTPGTPFTNATIDPWSLFITNNRVANRMSNYSLFSGKLHLKILVNGNSFYYGRILAYYIPLPLQDTGTGTLGTVSEYMTGSQRQKLFIDPCTSTGGEMECPFMFPYDMVNLTVSSGGYNELGRLRLTELNALKHANGATTPVSITVFAWMEDVKLSSPTATDIAGITAQGADEYGSTPVAAAASAVAGVAGKMTKMPIIGPYARATELGAGALSSIAKVLGFSRPTDVESVTIMRHHNVGDLAVTNVPDSSMKLSTDVKQEVTVDPSVVGVGQGDEMIIADIASRESYLTSFQWATTATPDTCVWSTRVGPCVGYSATDGFAPVYTIPACCYASLPFRYWRGIMKYRFQIVASEYHKGRLKFVWDSVAGSVTPETNVAYTKIVDLASERDFTVDVPWGSRTTFLTCTTPPSTTVYRATPPLTTAGLATWNGVLTVYVQNDLTSPNSTVNNDISVNVYVSMCDAEFAAPTEYVKNLCPVNQSVVQGALETQGNVEHEESKTDDAPIMGDSKESMVVCDMDFGPLSSVYMGERIVSFRSLMKRFAMDWVWALTNATASEVVINMTDFPVRFAYTPIGFQSGSINKYDTGNNTIIRYLCMAFVAYRGGMRKKYVLSGVNNDTTLGTVQITRNSSTSVTAPVYTVPTTTSDIAGSVALMGQLSSGMEGSALTTIRQNSAIEVELPFYKIARFASTRYPYTQTSGLVMPVDELTHKIVLAKGAVNGGRLISYTAAAEDSSFFCFQGCQPFYISPTLT